MFDWFSSEEDTTFPNVDTRLVISFSKLQGELLISTPSDRACCDHGISEKFEACPSPRCSQTNTDLSLLHVSESNGSQAPPR